LDFSNCIIESDEVDLKNGKTFEIIKMFDQTSIFDREDQNLSQEEINDYVEAYLKETKPLKELVAQFKKTHPKNKNKSQIKEKRRLDREKLFAKAVDFISQGKSRKYICQILGIKQSDLNYAIYKKNHNLPSFPQKQGPKTKIKRIYIDYVTQILDKKHTNHVFFFQKISNSFWKKNLVN